MATFSPSLYKTFFLVPFPEINFISFPKARETWINSLLTYSRRVGGGHGIQYTTVETMNYFRFLLCPSLHAESIVRISFTHFFWRFLSVCLFPLRSAFLSADSQITVDRSLRLYILQNSSVADPEKFVPDPEPWYS